MKDCTEITKRFDSALYGELSATEIEEFNSHLKQCPDCSKEFAELKETLTLFKERERVEPEEEFINNFWNELNPKLEKESKYSGLWNEIKSLFDFDFKPSYQIAAGLTILILGIVIGKFLMSGPVQITNPSFSGNENQEQIAIQARAERYLDRSKVLLLGLMNFDADADDFETISFSHQQKISNELITEAADIKDNLNGNTDQQLRRLIDDIEMILLQIANLEQKQDIEGIELIKDGVDKRGIFLKINIREMKQSSQEPNIDTPSNDKKENNT